jgi:hypothetical protein
MELDRHGAELLFQILTDREEEKAIAIASNEAFSKAHMFARRCARRCRDVTGSLFRMAAGAVSTGIYAAVQPTHASFGTQCVTGSF